MKVCPQCLGFGKYSYVIFSDSGKEVITKDPCDKCNGKGMVGGER